MRTRAPQDCTAPARLDEAALTNGTRHMCAVLRHACLFNATIVPFGGSPTEEQRAAAAAQRIMTANIDRPVGSVVYTCFCDERGGIVMDGTATRVGPEEVRQLRSAICSRAVRSPQFVRPGSGRELPSCIQPCGHDLEGTESGFRPRAPLQTRRTIGNTRDNTSQNIIVAYPFKFIGVSKI